MMALVLGLAWASHIPLGKFVRRIGIPACFTALVALPALFSPVHREAPLPNRAHRRARARRRGAVPPRPYTLMWPPPFPESGGGNAGPAGSGAALPRRYPISLPLLFSMTTPWAAACGLLRTGGLGEALADLLSTTRRYIVLLLQRAEEILVSIRSRMVGRLPVGEGRRILAGVAGALLAIPTG